jgi:hypothetical protein
LKTNIIRFILGVGWGNVIIEIGQLFYFLETYGYFRGFISPQKNIMSTYTMGTSGNQFFQIRNLQKKFQKKIKL